MHMHSLTVTDNQTYFPCYYNAGLSLMPGCCYTVQDFDVAAPENFIDEIENKIVQSMQIWSAPCFSGRISFSHV
jgi:hypothetical protein